MSGPISHCLSWGWQSQAAVAAPGGTLHQPLIPTGGSWSFRPCTSWWPQAQLIEAQLWMQDKDYEQAAAATGRLLKSDPGHLEALVLRGKAYYYLNGEGLGL